jgi:rRNA maturation endonuclease Nob1
MGEAGFRTEAPAFTPAVARATRNLYSKVAHVVPEIEWAVHAPYIQAINELKRQKNAVILGHNYMTPEIFHCVADFVGDSLQLAREAAKTDAKVIVQAGVHFMAETSKILSPDKTVLIPDPLAGCSLAASITGADVRLLKQKYPGLPVVTYVNTSAEVKAESDVCCTSSNAVAVVEDIARERGVDTVIMIPDEYLAQNVAKQTAVKIISWKGRCEVHERFSAADIRAFREANPACRCAGPSRMPAGSGGSFGFRGLDFGHDRLCRQAPSRARGDGHGMLDERQCGGGIPRCGFRAALQSLSAHEAHHPAENPACACRR